MIFLLLLPFCANQVVHRREVHVYAPASRRTCVSCPPAANTSARNVSQGCLVAAQIHDALVARGIGEGDAAYYAALEAGVRSTFPQRWQQYSQSALQLNAAAAQRGALNAIVPYEAALANRGAWQHAAAAAAQDSAAAPRLRSGRAAGASTRSEQFTQASHEVLGSRALTPECVPSTSPECLRQSGQKHTEPARAEPNDTAGPGAGRLASARRSVDDVMLLPRPLAQRSRFSSARLRGDRLARSYSELALLQHKHQLHQKPTALSQNASARSSEQGTNHAQKAASLSTSNVTALAEAAHNASCQCRPTALPTVPEQFNTAVQSTQHMRASKSKVNRSSSCAPVLPAGRLQSWGPSTNVDAGKFAAVDGGFRRPFGGSEQPWDMSTAVWSDQAFKSAAWLRR